MVGTTRTGAPPRRTTPGGTPLRTRFQRWLFRYGQAALDSGHLVAPGAFLRSLRAPVEPVDDLRPGVLVVQKDAFPDGADLWIGCYLHDLPQDSTVAEIVLTTVDGGAVVWSGSVELRWFGIEAERETTGRPFGNRFFHAHCEVRDGLEPDRRYRASVEVRDAPHTATCLVRTLPTALAPGRELTVFAASCYDVDTDRADEFASGYARVFGEGPGPDLTWLCGDAVYLDAPWWHYGTLARHTPRTYYLQEYWTTWGGQGRPGLRPLLAAGPTWFLPDDHEFWNNWPHRSVTAHHSWAHIGRTAVNAAKRNAPGASDEGEAARPLDPQRAPTDTSHQNLLPVHPDEWDDWSRGAFDLFGSFQTRTERDRATGRITLGERPDPERPPTATVPPHGAHAPLNRVVQHIRLDPVQVVLLDTRTRRVRKHDEPGWSAFVDEPELDRVLQVAAAAEVFVLVMAQPALKRPAHLHRGLADRLGLVPDRGIEDYGHQYHRLWSELLRGRMGRPTITVGGDIHRSYVGFAETESLLEVVASPMSLVHGLGVFDRVVGLWRSIGGTDDYEPGAPLVAMADLLTPPDGDAPDRSDVARCLASLPDRCPGFSTLRFARPEAEPDVIRLDVTLHPRNAHQADRTRTERFALRLGAEGVPSIERLTRQEAP
ncbi:hypothetical protein [Pseudonocardia humida]|uniref:PhoD-like phosphatase n=1 Tax=Pseudonocardia humida TaxID=2800819 RepID=A0ABT0ZV22_9PSEU|nr:hypothetical protein [Pseudonocardia humida]MCO1654524.1 hypothetical protein [Pseudonocardia humida]